MMKRLLFGIFVILFSASVCHSRMVSIANEKVNLRSGPGTKYTVLWELGKGFPLRVVASKGNWLKVLDFEKDTGWIYKKLITDKRHLIVKKKRVNIRNNRGKKGKIIGKANYGVVFQTLKTRSGWANVKHENGLTGWIKRDLLWGW
ncbi:MAG: SH3 domain-containing protein [Thermodesulfobacteriota bacterium]|nr:SH3 domain-containing protein [Thermodesulfobacteriota bacterium]